MIKVSILRLEPDRYSSVLAATAWELRSYIKNKRCTSRSQIRIQVSDIAGWESLLEGIVLIRMNYADECCGDVADVSNRLN